MNTMNLEEGVDAAAKESNIVAMNSADEGRIYSFTHTYFCSSHVSIMHHEFISISQSQLKMQTFREPTIAIVHSLLTVTVLK